MKTSLPVLCLAFAAAAAVAADSPQEKLTKATRELADKPNYSWTTTTKEGDGSSGRLGPIDGKSEKQGITFLSFAVGGVPVEVFLKADKGAARALEGWMTLDEIAQTSGTAAAVVRFLKSYKTPATHSAELARQLKDAKEEEGVVSGELKEDAIKELLLLGTRRRDGQEAPTISDAKGAARFWIKEGALTKYEINAKGKVAAGDRTMDIDRTLTVELKEVGSTKIEVPTEAQQKLS